MPGKQAATAKPPVAVVEEKIEAVSQQQQQQQMKMNKENEKAGKDIKVRLKSLYFSIDSAGVFTETSKRAKMSNSWLNRDYLPAFLLSRRPNLIIFNVII